MSTISIQIHFYTFIARPHGTGIVKPSWRWKTGVWCTPRTTSLFLSTSSYLYFFSLSMCLVSIFYPSPSPLFLNFELLAPYPSLSYRPLFKSPSLFFSHFCHYISLSLFICVVNIFLFFSCHEFYFSFPVTLKSLDFGYKYVYFRNMCLTFVRTFRTKISCLMPCERLKVSFCENVNTVRKNNIFANIELYFPLTRRANIK